MYRKTVCSLEEIEINDKRVYKEAIRFLNQEFLKIITMTSTVCRTIHKVCHNHDYEEVAVCCKAELN